MAPCQHITRHLIDFGNQSCSLAPAVHFKNYTTVGLLGWRGCVQAADVWSIQQYIRGGVGDQ